MKLNLNINAKADPSNPEKYRVEVWFDDKLIHIVKENLSTTEAAAYLEAVTFTSAAILSAIGLQTTASLTKSP